jgi:glucokinase
VASQVLAVDIGGTKLAAALVDENGTVLHADRTPTTPGASGEELWNELVELTDGVRRAGGSPDVVGVGIGSGGPMQWPSGEISPLNIPGWRDFPLRARFQERFPGVPVRVHNDAVAVAIAEHWRGAAQGTDNMLGMVVSTGVGGGLVLGGHVVDGLSGNAGHIGHVVVDPDSPPCVCGGIGCLEAVARGPALADWAYQNGWRADRPAEERTGRDLGEDARGGHEVAIAAFARAGRAVGIAIASAKALCDVEVVAIGGGVSQVGDLLFGPLQATLDRHAGLEFTKRVRVVPAALGQAAGLVGAAALVHHGERYWSAD